MSDIQMMWAIMIWSLIGAILLTVIPILIAKEVWKYRQEKKKEKN